MRAGRLRHRLVFSAPSSGTPNAFGEDQESTWSVAGTVWGSIEPLTGRELEHARQIHATVTHMITVRYNPSVAFSPTWRVEFGSRTFGILSVLKTDERNHEIKIVAQEIVA